MNPNVECSTTTTYNAEMRKLGLRKFRRKEKSLSFTRLAQKQTALVDQMGIRMQNQLQKPL